MFRSVWDRIHSGMDPFCLHGTGSKLERYSSTFISGPFGKNFPILSCFSYQFLNEYCKALGS